MQIGNICWNCKKHFYRDSEEKKIVSVTNKKLVFCSLTCLDIHEFEISKFIMKGYDYIPPIK